MNERIEHGKWFCTARTKTIATRTVTLQVMTSRASASRTHLPVSLLYDKGAAAMAKATASRFWKTFTRICESAINIWALFIAV